jgi:hypothetical protein
MLEVRNRVRKCAATTDKCSREFLFPTISGGLESRRAVSTARTRWSPDFFTAGSKWSPHPPLC